MRAGTCWRTLLRGRRERAGADVRRACATGRRRRRVAADRELHGGVAAGVGRDEAGRLLRRLLVAVGGGVTEYDDDVRRFFGELPEPIGAQQLLWQPPQHLE